MHARQVGRVVVRQGADDRVAIGQPGQPGEVLADPDAWDAGGDGPELAPHFGGRLGLGVPGVELGRAAPHEQQDARLRPALRLPPTGRAGVVAGLRREQVAEAEPEDTEPSDAQHASPGQASRPAELRAA